MIYGDYTIILDSDGILGSTQLTYNASGKIQKQYSVNDSLTISFMTKFYKQFKFIVLTGDVGYGLEITKKRLDDIELIDSFVYCKNIDKYNYIKSNYNMEKVIYIGDDIYDFLILQECFYGCTVNNAPKHIKHSANYISPYIGGANAVTDILLEILIYFGIDYITDMETHIKINEKNIKDTRI